MQIDNKSFDYLPLDLPNVQVSVTKGYKGVISESRSTALRSLTSTLALRKPQWRFVVAGRKVYVYENNELLGSIWENQQRAGSPFAIAGHRVDKKVKRGTNLHTKDAKKAVKLVFQNFIPRNLNEKTKAAIENVKAGVSNLHSQRYYAYNANKDVVYAKLGRHVRDNWAAIEQELLAAYSGIPEKEDRVKAYPESARLLKSMQDMTNDMSHGKGVFVSIVDGTYCIAKTDNPEEVVQTFSELPEKYKQQVGMLKLVEDDQAISGMGFRRDANTFFVMENDGKEAGEPDED